MKKTYMQPAAEAIELKYTASLMAGSLEKNSTSTITNESAILGRDNDFDFDDEEEY